MYLYHNLLWITKIILRIFLTCDQEKEQKMGWEWVRDSSENILSLYSLS